MHVCVCKCACVSVPIIPWAHKHWYLSETCPCQVLVGYRLLKVSPATRVCHLETQLWGKEMALPLKDLRLHH